MGKVAMDQHGAEGYQETTEVRQRGADRSDHSLLTTCYSPLTTHYEYSFRPTHYRRACATPRR